MCSGVIQFGEFAFRCRELVYIMDSIQLALIYHGLTTRGNRMNLANMQKHITIPNHVFPLTPERRSRRQRPPGNTDGHSDRRCVASDRYAAGGRGQTGGAAQQPVACPTPAQRCFRSYDPWSCPLKCPRLQRMNSRKLRANDQRRNIALSTSPFASLSIRQFI